MEEIEVIVEEHNVKDAFMGLILVPLVEKAAEHLTGKDPLKSLLPYCMPTIPIIQPSTKHGTTR